MSRMPEAGSEGRIAANGGKNERSHQEAADINCGYALTLFIY